MVQAKPKTSTVWTDYLDESTPPDLKSRLMKKFPSLPTIKMMQPEFYKDLQKDLQATFLTQLVSVLTRMPGTRVKGM
ncbi:hypothetical protein HDU99_008466, partial [Rhizoclosmatium hyalinum]